MPLPFAPMLGAVPGLSALSGLSTSAGAVEVPDVATNLLVNPGVEVWQRGTGPFSATNGYNADRWVFSNGGGSTYSLSRDGTNQDAGSQYCAAITYTHASPSWQGQYIESWQQLRGRTVTLTARVRTSVANGARLFINDSVQQVFSGYHSGSGAYETLKLTYVISPSTPTAIVLGVYLTVSGTYYVDNATLVIGAAALPWAPLHAADDLLRCQRYYWELGGLDLNETVGVGQNISATVCYLPLRFPVEMAIAPNVGVSAAADFRILDSGGGPQGCTAISAQVVTRRSCRLNVTVAAGLTAGMAGYMGTANTAAARLWFVANP